MEGVKEINKRVLIIDDKESPRIGLSHLIKENIGGYEVLTANSAEKAIEILLSGEKIDILLTDFRFRLKGRNGIELIRYIKIVFLDNIRTILMSGLISKTDERIAKEAGVDAILHKPFSLDVLAGTLRGLSSVLLIRPDIK